MDKKQKEYLNELIKELEGIAEQIENGINLEDLETRVSELESKFGGKEAKALLSVVSKFSESNINIFSSHDLLIKHLEDNVNHYVKLALTGKNYDKIALKDNISLLRTILEAKVQVDRWDQVSNVFLFNLDNEDFVIKTLGDKVSFYNGSYHLWGAAIKFINDVPENKGMVLSLLNNGDLGAKTHEQEDWTSVCIFDISQN